MEGQKLRNGLVPIKVVCVSNSHSLWVHKLSNKPAVKCQKRHKNKNARLRSWLTGVPGNSGGTFYFVLWLLRPAVRWIWLGAHTGRECVILIFVLFFSEVMVLWRLDSRRRKESHLVRGHWLRSGIAAPRSGGEVNYSAVSCAREM